MAGPRRSPRSAPNGQKTAVGIKDSRSRGGAAEKPTVSDSSSPRGRRSTRSRATGENRSESADRSTAAGSTPSPSRRNQALLSTDATAVGEGPGAENSADAAAESGRKPAADARSTMCAPATPRKSGGSATPLPKAPVQARTPSEGLAAQRFDAETEKKDDHSLTPRKDKSRGPNRLLELDGMETPTKTNKGRTCFGSPAKDRVVVPPAVSRVYGLVQKATGSIGGNGSCGAIYGELTVGCMQKVVNCLREETGFDADSCFIDVGSGLGKPNFHVAQDPGCEISYGLELEEVRWQLSVANHRWVLRDGGSGDGVSVKKHNLFFAHGDILSAKTFNPFSHVYMFDIGFPPATLKAIAKMFNASEARHLISYQKPYKVMDEYGFDVEKVLQLPLNLTVSHEGHMMYLYRRKGVPARQKSARIEKSCFEVFVFNQSKEEHVGSLTLLESAPASAVDPFFEQGVRFCRGGPERGQELAAHVEACFTEHISGGVVDTVLFPAVVSNRTRWSKLPWIMVPLMRGSQE